MSDVRANLSPGLLEYADVRALVTEVERLRETADALATEIERLRDIIWDEFARGPETPALDAYREQQN